MLGSEKESDPIGAGKSIVELSCECRVIEMSREMTMRIGVLASHEGTTLQAIIDACGAGALNATVVAVISNNRDAGALHRARAAGIRVYHLSSRTHSEARALDAAICQALADEEVDVVVLAGYMKKLGPETLARFRGRVLNTHPALLPRFGGKGMYGVRVHEAVLAAGEATSGASVHLVEEDYDTGPVIAQTEVAVLEGDTPDRLGARVQERERELLVDVLARIADGRISLPGRAAIFPLRTPDLDLGALLAESEQAGLRLVRRLVEEWVSGANRFDRSGEELFGARLDGRVVGVCGLNVDPYAAKEGVGRVRHLYVLSAFRRRGVGRALIAAVIEAARGRFGELRLRTGNAEAARLYEAIGFQRSSQVADCTHIMKLG
jgi:phosphoribosylglycinamide formyltransferase-1